LECIGVKRFCIFLENDKKTEPICAKFFSWFHRLHVQLLLSSKLLHLIFTLTVQILVLSESAFKNNYHNAYGYQLVMFRCSEHALFSNHCQLLNCFLSMCTILWHVHDITYIILSLSPFSGLLLFSLLLMLFNKPEIKLTTIDLSHGIAMHQCTVDGRSADTQLLSTSVDITCCRYSRFKSKAYVLPLI